MKPLETALLSKKAMKANSGSNFPPKPPFSLKSPKVSQNDSLFGV
jgi:hypothetical protein